MRDAYNMLGKADAGNPLLRAVNYQGVVQQPSKDKLSPDQVELGKKLGLNEEDLKIKK